MATNIATLSAKAVLDEKGYASGTDKMVGDTSRLEATLKASFSRIRSTFDTFTAQVKSGSIFNASAFTGAFTGSMAGGGLIDTFKNLTSHANDLALAQFRMQREFGLSEQSAAGFIRLGKLSGISAEELAGHTESAARHLGELRNQLNLGETGGAAAAALQRLSINASDFVELPLPQALAQFGDRLKTIESPTERFALLFSVFGRNARELLPILERGSAGLNSATGTATPFGQEDIRAAREMRTAIRDLQEGWETFWGRIAIGLTRIVNRLRRSGTGEPELTPDQQWVQEQNRLAHEQALEAAATAADTPEHLAELQRRLGQMPGQQFVSLAGEINNPTSTQQLNAALLQRIRLLPQSAEAQIAASTSADQYADSLRLQIATMGMSADEIEIYTRRIHGLTAAQALQLEKLQALRAAEAQRVSDRRRFLELVDTTASPLDRMRDRLLEVNRIVGNNDPNRAGIIGRIFRDAGLVTPGGFQQPLLGSLEATGSDTAAILQESMSPQVDELVEIQAGLENMQRVLERIAEADERIAAAYDNGEFGPFVP